MSQVFTLSIGKAVKIDAIIRVTPVVARLPSNFLAIPATVVSLMTVYTKSLDKDFSGGNAMLKWRRQ